MLEYKSIEELCRGAEKLGCRISELVLSDQAAQLELSEDELYSRMDARLTVMEESIKAGMNPVALKQKYGDKLVFHGGINAVLWSKPDEIRAEIERVVPVMKQGGGYIFASDHSIPDNISLENFKLVLETLRRVGSY